METGKGMAMVVGMNAGDDNRSNGVNRIAERSKKEAQANQMAQQQ